MPAAEVEANRRETQRLDALERPLREAKRKIEAPFMQQILDREIAKLPDYMQLAWKTPPEKRTEGQKLNVIQIEKTMSNDTLRALVTEKDVVALMPDDVKAKHAAVAARDGGARQAAAEAARRPRWRSANVAASRSHRSSCIAAAPTRPARRCRPACYRS